MTVSKRIIAKFSSAALIAGLALGMQAPLAVTNAAMAAGNSGWLDRDNPGGKGDYEDTKSLLKQECRFVKAPGALIPAGSSGGYHNVSPTGCWCVNSEVKAATGGKKSCEDIKIRYFWK